MTEIRENTALKALINLLDEPDENSFTLVRDKLFSYGSEAIPLLDNAMENSFDMLIRGRITEILGKIRMDQLRHEFSAWVNFGSSDLLKGFLQVSAYENFSLDKEELTRKVEQIKMDVWLELNDNLTALENIKVLNHIFYEVHHFDGKQSHNLNSGLFFLDHLLETHKGNPLSLGILYMVIAQRLKLPVFGVNLPQHFILAYLIEPGITGPAAEDVLFYINPFNQGSVFTRREIELFIHQLKIKPELSFFAPCSNADVIERMLRNLIFTYKQTGEPEKIQDLESLLKIIEGE